MLFYFKISCILNILAVCPGFRPYQQEDAHEFLLGLLSRMEDNTMAGLGKIPRSLSETNAIRRIFGGTVRSEGKSINSIYGDSLFPSAHIIKGNIVLVFH